MIKAIITTFTLTLVSTTFANPKEREQSARNSVKEKIEMYTQEIKDRCGNKKVNIQLDWKTFDKLDYSKHVGLSDQKPEDKKSMYMDGAGFQSDFEKVLSTVYNICQKDKNKTVVRKIENIYIYVQQETPTALECFQYDKAKKALFAKIGLNAHCKGNGYDDLLIQTLKSEGAVSINL